MRTGVPMTASERSAIRELAASGMRKSDVARKMGCSLCAVDNAAGDLYPERHTHRWSRDEDAELVRVGPERFAELHGTMGLRPKSLRNRWRMLREHDRVAAWRRGGAC